MTEIRRRRTGGRSARIHAQITDAAIAEFLEKGALGLTMPAIAQRAGVHPTTLYRRWPDAGAIFLDAISSRSSANIQIPDTGTLADDLELFLSALDNYVRSPLGRGLLAYQLIGGEYVRDLRERFWDERFGRAAAMIERGKARGEVPADTSARQMLEAVIAPVYLNVIATGGVWDIQARKRHIQDVLLIIGMRSSPASTRLA